MVKRKLTASITSTQTAYFSLHGAVILLALCALFAKWLTLPALYIVVGRSLFAALAILLFCRFNSLSLNLSKHLIIKLALSGLILAMHWWSFFYTIQISSVTIGLLTFACFPLFVAVMSIALKLQKLTVSILVQALLCILGIYLVEAAQPIAQSDITALAIGLFSALSFAILTMFNQKFVQHCSPIAVTFWQNLFAGLWLCPALFIYQIWPSANETLLIALLGIVFTALAHSLLLSSLKVINAFLVSLTLTLEPLYGITAAWLLLDERLTLSIFAGAGLIILMNYWATREQINESAN
ncbi:DMT family transporter [Thalassotalea fonticola]|uniref:DMT family transporter n=1 Tax=Thalassotalea fonticola TaxID=3065649 RepID=A0ABZ0GL05_9GAMM|nr:DMT family transporter [Colwelliaceae bacterium S1-1]